MAHLPVHSCTLVITLLHLMQNGNAKYRCNDQYPTLCEPLPCARGRWMYFLSVRLGAWGFRNWKSRGTSWPRRVLRKLTFRSVVRLSTHTRSHYKTSVTVMAWDSIGPPPASRQTFMAVDYNVKSNIK
ncbi:hypothetical protein EDD16DRAFT_37900 [Pisolithus croceorrhizus]|nr:hypothetical protein EDD16DRAFT_37900 [Pisolithus croceorrhizus]